MATKKKERKPLFSKLKNKYRLVIMNDDTFEEKASLKLSPLNVFVSVGTISILLVVLIIYSIAFTPLREYIPGYADLGMQRKVIALGIKADSLEAMLKAKEAYVQNINNIMNGTVGDNDDKGDKSAPVQRYDTIKSLKKSKEDSLLRQQIEGENKFELSTSTTKTFTNSISNFFFFTPVKGTVTNTFDPPQKHFGVDVVAQNNEAIKATLDGTVIIANWSSETGYVMALQHSNNMISVYKHNSALLKKIGNYVKAGEAIAIIGNSGELTTGPHLHFELWYNGTAMNPLQYIAF
jgi:murein DD-endopeptidase MepM/ murein hydrolase activator NlpD